MFAFYCLNTCGDVKPWVPTPSYTAPYYYVRGYYVCDEMDVGYWNQYINNWKEIRRGGTLFFWFTNRHFGSFDCSGVRGETYAWSITLP
jgi:hypothetical protein